MEAKSSMHILIVGGGIGGLGLAQYLKKAGISFSIFERDRSPTDRLQGYRLHISPQGSQALFHCLPDSLFNLFVSTCGKPGSGFRMISHQREELFFLPTDLNRDPRESHHSASRITLRQILLSGLEENIHFDRKFSRYSLEPDGRVKAWFEDGSSATGDLLVGADGVNSQVRQALLPDARITDTGVLGIAGKVPLTGEFNEFDGANMVSGPNGDGLFIARQEFASPQFPSNRSDLAEMGSEKAKDFLFDNTKSYLFWAYSAEKESFPKIVTDPRVSPEQLFESVVEKIRPWHSSFRNLIAHTDRSTVSLWKIRTSLPVEPWTTNAITLLGDAIHSMTPFRGIGANIALQDAQVLGQKLIAVTLGEKTLLGGVHEFESEMLDYGFSAVRASLRALEQTIKRRSKAEKMIQKAVLRTLNHLPTRLKGRLFA